MYILIRNIMVTWFSFFSIFKGFLNIYLPCVCVYVCMYMCVNKEHTCAKEFVCNQSEDNFQEFVLSFHHAGPGDWSQVINLSRDYIYLVSHLAHASAYHNTFNLGCETIWVVD